jgi:hypothetical protein
MLPKRRNVVTTDRRACDEVIRCQLLTGESIEPYELFSLWNPDFTRSLTSPSRNFASPNFASPNFASPNFASPNFASPNFVSPNFAKSECEKNTAAAVAAVVLHARAGPCRIRRCWIVAY